MAVAGQVRRIDVLAQPKPVPQVIEDRRSVYWVDKRPLESNGNTSFVLTARLEELARPKPVNNGYLGDRPTPIWPVSETAQEAHISQRMAALAYPKLAHSDYKYDRTGYPIVSNAARSAEPTPRLHSLATPKPHKIWQNSNDTYCEGEFNKMIWPVSESAKRGRCSQRVEVLASAKQDHPQYLGERSVQWPVSETAKNNVATLRLQQLARPKSGRLRKDDYDPYRVSRASCTARPTPRVLELALPIPRKVRQKKN